MQELLMVSNSVTTAVGYTRMSEYTENVVHVLSRLLNFCNAEENLATFPQALALEIETTVTAVFARFGKQFILALFRG